MQSQQSGQAPSPDPNNQPASAAPVQPTIEERLVALETQAQAAQKVDAPQQLLTDTGRGEWWLIRINGLMLFAQIIVAGIYILQLEQMRVATTASTQATQLASDSLQYSASQFDRSMVQATSQSASAYGSTEAARNAANAATKALTLTQDQFARENRAYLTPVDTNLKGGGYGMVKISLRNYGHISGRNAIFAGSLDRISAVSSPVVQESIPVHLPVATVVIPSDVPTYTWDVFTPNYGPHFPVPEDTLRILGHVTYDDGFGHRQAVEICYGFQTVKNQWELCDSNTSTFVKHQQPQ